MNIINIHSTNGVTYNIEFSSVSPCLVMCTGTSGGSIYFIGNSVCEPIIAHDNFVVIRIDPYNFTVKQTFNTRQVILILHSPLTTVTYTESTGK